ncbi:MAG: hypothetical protein ABI199_01415 [Bacteroidia bacterium]
MQKEIASMHRDKTMLNLSEAKTVALLFNADDREEFELVKKYVTYLKELRKKVKIIGYFTTKELMSMSYSKLDYTFFSAKELTWFQKPTDLYINNFIAEEHDILLDLNIHDCFPLTYIAAISKSKCKVGKYTEEFSEIYDLMIETDLSKGMKYFLRNVDTYIDMLNKKTNPAAAENQI